MKYRSFVEFLHQYLTDLGFARKGRTYWYRRDPKALIVINLQKSAFGPGVYLNYGLCFSKRKNPKEFECEVFGRNPALSSSEFSSFQDCLTNIAEICKNEVIQEKLKAAISRQIACLAEWQDLEMLRSRIRRKRTFEIVVDRVKLKI